MTADLVKNELIVYRKVLPFIGNVAPPEKFI